MRRIARRPFTLASVVSLLLCVAACVLWAVSRDRAAGLLVYGNPADYMLDSHAGAVTCVRQAHRPRGALSASVVHGRPLFFWQGRYRGRSVKHVQEEELDLYSTLDDDWPLLTSPPYTGWQTWAGPPMLFVEDTENDGAQYGITPAWSGAGVFVAAQAFPDSRATHHIVVVLPHWLIAVGTAVLPAVALGRRGRRMLRTRGGRCASCGYDLRATPARCPECGAGRTG